MVSYTQQFAFNSNSQTTDTQTDPIPVADPVVPSVIGTAGPGGDGEQPLPYVTDPFGLEGEPDPSDGADLAGGLSPVIGGGTLTVSGGRVTTMRLDADVAVADLRILDAPAEGRITVNPDKSLALVLSQTDYTGPLSFRVEVTAPDGSTSIITQSLNVTPRVQAAGWGGGEFYMLATDADDDVIVETGDHHRKVYVSKDAEALTLSDIAALEGIAVSAITGEWLAAHPDYGATEDMALAEDAGLALWWEITGYKSEPSSHWLLLERGYEYGGLGQLVAPFGSHGEDPMHPIHITSYGTGDRPVVTTLVKIFQDVTENMVFSDIELGAGIRSLTGSNMIFDDVKFTGGMINLQNADAVTFHNSEVVDIVLDGPSDPSKGWQEHVDRTGGMFVDKSSHILIEGGLFHHNGWEDDYRWDMSAEGGQPPSMFSHNVYVQNTVTDVTFRDNLVAQGASYGAQIRGGGFIEDNIFLDNNAGVNFYGGVYSGDGPIGNYTLFTDNVVTSAGYKTIDGNIGAVSGGILNWSFEATMLDNILAHLADPDNPTEQAEKYETNWSVKSENTPYYDDTIIYRWYSPGKDYLGEAGKELLNRNVDGLDRDTLDTTSIQRFASILLGKDGATIKDLMDHLRALDPEAYDAGNYAQLIVDYFQAGFGVLAADRTDAETLRFVPSDLADGFRWDNRLNWTTEDLPGSVAGDSVDLGGNWVQYGGTSWVRDFDFGDGGHLEVSHGRLDVTGRSEAGTGGGSVTVSNAGQFWIDGYDDAEGDALRIEVTGGRFVNTGSMAGDLEINIFGGDALLATDDADLDLDAGDVLNIFGSDADVGFDGDSGGISTLTLGAGARLRFVADADGVSTLGEVRTGAFGDSPDVRSGVNLDLGRLDIDVSAIAGTTAEMTLIEVDALIGRFGAINVTGLGSSQDARLTLDYASDTLVLRLLGPGSGTGSVDVVTTGRAEDASADAELWAALTGGTGVAGLEAPDPMLAWVDHGVTDPPPPVFQDPEPVPEPVPADPVVPDDIHTQWFEHEHQGYV